MMEMKPPTNGVPLVDGDILRYEVGFAAETGWRAITEDEEALPPFDYVRKILHQRLDHICKQLEVDQEPVIYLTEGNTFRFDIAKSKPYKGTRVDKKPWHYKNLTVYIRDVLNSIVVTGIEADDAIAIDHVNDPNSIICSRDKDLRQVPGWFYSWELGWQPSFGPENITKAGSLMLSDDGKNKLTGTGLAFFYAQIIMGDGVDNIPGLPGWGPVAAYKLLVDKAPEDMFLSVLTAYEENYVGNMPVEDYLLEQGRLCWMTRRLNEDGSPELWELGMEE